MPEIGLGLEPGTRAGRAGVVRTGPGWDKARGLADAADRSHHPSLPPAVQEITDRGEPPPPPSEPELRSELAERLTAEKQAQAVRDKANATHQRAEAHLQECKQALTSFDDLQSTIDARTRYALRNNRRADLTQEMREQLNLREHSRMSFAGADAAALQFSNELADAEAKLTICTQAVNKALVPLLGVTAAEGFVRDIRGHEEQIKRKQSLLLGFDRLAAAADSTMPETVRDYHFDNLRGRVGTVEMFSVWTDAASKLRADPQAQVTIDDPPAPPPPPQRAPASYQIPHVREVMLAQAKARAEQAQTEPPEAA
jgi:hypothetical protein